LKFLIDNALSPVLAKKLQEAGYDALHVRDIGLASATDDEIFTYALRENRIIVSADTDFGTILSLQQQSKPSLILFRRSTRKPERQAEVLKENLPSLEEFLNKGSVAVFEDRRIRIRQLPIGSSTE